MKRYSEQGQDVFVSSLIKDGFFLDIGSNGPISGNNTYLLESYGWNGLSVDLNRIGGWDQRRTKCIELDATKVNWLDFLENNNVPKIIDYLSVDIDHANMHVINNFPFDKYQFKLMTFETNQWAYLNWGGEWLPLQEASLKALGKYPQYTRIVSNLMFEGRAFEDWWINKEHFPSSITSLNLNEIDWRDAVTQICEASKQYV
jgi:hypothetical protein